MDGALLFIECIVIVLFICFWGIVVRFIVSLTNLSNTTIEYLNYKMDCDNCMYKQSHVAVQNPHKAKESNNNDDYQPF